MSQRNRISFLLAVKPLHWGVRLMESPHRYRMVAGSNLLCAKLLTLSFILEVRSIFLTPLFSMQLISHGTFTVLGACPAATGTISSINLGNTIEASFYDMQSPTSPHPRSRASKVAMIRCNANALTAAFLQLSYPDFNNIIPFQSWWCILMWGKNGQVSAVSIGSGFTAWTNTVFDSVQWHGICTRIVHGLSRHIILLTHIES